MDELTEREAAILAFEGQWFKYSGAKEQAAREQFDVSWIGYHQELNALLDKPAALASDPRLVRRLQKAREQRRRHARAVADSWGR